MWIFALWACTETTSHLFTSRRESLQAVAFNLTDVSAPLHLPCIAKDMISIARPVGKIFLFLPGNKNQVLFCVVEMNQKDDQKQEASHFCGVHPAGKNMGEKGWGVRNAAPNRHPASKADASWQSVMIYLKFNPWERILQKWWFANRRQWRNINFHDGKQFFRNVLSFHNNEENCHDSAHTHS